MFKNFLSKTAKKDFVRSRLRNFFSKRTSEIIGDFQPYLEGSHKILDLGCGSCHVWERLVALGFDVVGTDIKDTSMINGLNPVIARGEKLPFANNSFDLVLLSTVLHHTNNPEKVLMEAKRVARKIIIVEDTYKNTAQKYLTFVMDSVLNFEFIGHPHSNRDLSGWHQTFDKVGLKLIAEKSRTFWRFFQTTTFALKK